ncbi:G-type lectin S-receptor-like serine/threonine-protein kinase RKS1 isoform X3 [Salvia hispanica]|nr:G-type lectin S-receptor-like serine/threonine-protein kinase RKS1 isoform X3 [Salvia hispanica]
MGTNGSSDLSIRKGEKILWSSGPWQGGTFQSLDLNYPYNITYLARDGDVSVTYNNNNKSVLSRILINHRGRMELFQWLEVRQTWDLLIVKPYSCGAYAMCGPNTMCDTDPSPACRCLSGFKPRVEVDWDFSSGCVRKRPFHCTDKVGYIKVTTSRLPESQESVELPNNVCELQCSKKCSCTAYAYGSGGKCILLKEDFLDLETPTNNSAGVDLHVKVKQKGKSRVLLLELVLPITAALLSSCFGFCYARPKLTNWRSKDTHQNLLLLNLDTHGEEKNDKYELPIFSFSSIVASTNNFSMENKLGEGGFGPVYKGELMNGLFVAVKRLSKRSGQGLEEFRNETEVIAKLQHRNLVRILGCCVENNEMILVYEYMPNNSLDFFIFEPTSGGLLEWAKRVQIIEGIAQGLLYLHHYSRLRIVHRDLKASNILLDAEMNPKISDFGMARIFGGNNMQANTERIVGTYGYMSPEYAMEGLFSVKSDVFAFGILMLEIISGKKNTGFYGSEYLSLLGYTWNAWIHGRAVEVVDPSLERPASSSAVLRYIKIGLLCVQENPADRPLMSDVVGMLSSEDAEMPSPLNPAFTVTRSSNKVQICSANGLTLSHVEAR